MKLEERFPNYKNAFFSVMGEYNPAKGYSDTNQISFVLRQSKINGNRAVDFFELNRLNDGSVYYKIETMIGLKLILTNESHKIEDDLSYLEWIDLIQNVNIKHFFNPEYQALKEGFVKQKGGCTTVFLFFTVLALFFIL
ncbi:hypothetical protein SAMN05216503_2241 [Polaribacter sp. KT25b]|uniref:hypothetical protein n=1 Tax=Polaribacter sp. KT25b TaxID=1855336 RepID=UPI00087D5620|nr:hypothetical protein [Polaribacter sp. KT25b]SDS18386.1 hypothetical protein SAMN05216503_2241 [Polaribacter sp. KT25b]